MWKLSESASIVNDANNHSESKTKRLLMKTKMASCVCAAAMLLTLSFGPVVHAQTSGEQASGGAGATLILKTGERLKIKLISIDEVSIDFEMPGLVSPGQSDPQKPLQYSKGLNEVAKLILVEGDENHQGIVLKTSNDPICGVVKSFVNNLWTIQRTDSRSIQTYDGIGQIRSVDFVNTCPEIKPGPKYIGCYKDDRRRDLDGGMTKLKNTDECLKRCFDSGFKYAGLQNGNQCFCGNQYGAYGKMPDAECGRHGGRWRNSIYQVR